MQMCNKKCIARLCCHAKLLEVYGITDDHTRITAITIDLYRNLEYTYCIMSHTPTHASPWLYELRRNRSIHTLEENTSTDVLIIGGGISGILTAEALLSRTDFNVVIVEATQIAHGATGHNAGQLTTYFERPLRSIIDEYGHDASYNTLHAIEHAHHALLAIKEYYKLSVPLYFFEGYTGISSVEQLKYFVEQQQARIDIGLSPWTIYITQQYLDLGRLELGEYPYFSLTDTDTIQRLLITESDQYGAIIAEQKGCANSARFTEELASALLENYSNRFRIYEHSPVKSVHFDKVITTTILNHSIQSLHCILCTNGFENFNITSSKQSVLNSYFHSSIEGLVGYMGAYTDTPADTPTAISYLTNNTDPQDYYYLTRRPFAMHNNTTHNLISVGGPDNSLDEVFTYDAFTEVDETTHTRIEKFLQKNYAPARDSDFTFSFLWNGLMGYTQSRLRLVGPDPREQRLIYNIGCNGVGILPAVISAPRIADMLNGNHVEPSIFDVQP
jgi:glycine/D-amino acid oxidase-like deaminating enzyme